MVCHSKVHICQCLGRILSRRRQRAVTVSGISGATRSGSQFVYGVLSLARAISALGIRSGDVVALAAFNSEWFLEWILAVTLVGGIVAPLNYRWSDYEATEAVLGLEPVAVVVDEACRRWADDWGNGTVASVRWCFLMGEFPVCLYDSHGSELDRYIMKKPVEDIVFDYIWAPEDIALICFTSGTTGRPKGVALSHMSLVIQSYAKITIVGYTEDDVYLHTAPLCHIGGLSSCIAMLMVGGCHVFQPKFDAKLTIQSIDELQVTSLITVPTLISILSSFIGKENEWAGGKSVRKILNGGGSLSHDLISAAVHMFPCAKLFSAYGMTEACSSLTFTTLYDPSSPKFGTTASLPPDQFTGVSVGKPPIHVELCIRSNTTGNARPVVGNILSRGPHLMVRYLSRNKGETLDRVSNDWLDTGDTGWIDDNGELWLLGRTNGRIKTGGENVYPEEVERVLLQHPGVCSVVVVGIPHNHFTEMIVACICIKGGWKWVNDGSPSREKNQLSSRILQAHCRQRFLSSFKIPKIFMLWEKPFPLTASGKLKREEVRNESISYLRFLPSNL